MNNFLWTHLLVIAFLSTVPKGSHGSEGICARIGGKIYNIETEKATWFEANNRCRRMKGNLIYIEHDLERENLVNYLTEEFSHSVFWTGVNNLADDGFHSTKTNAPITYSFWMHNLPHRPRSCVALKTQNSSLYMEAVPCDESYGFVCEMGVSKKLISNEVDISEVPPQPDPFSSIFVPVPRYRTGINYKKIKNKLYYISTEAVNWYQAQQRCHEMNLYLFAWENEAEWRAMDSYFKKIENRKWYWSGLNKELTYPYKWTWEKGLSTNVYLPWYELTSYFCAVASFRYDLIITDRPCYSDTHRFICQE